MNKRAVIVTDMGYGDAGKGTIVDYLVRGAESAVVVRHNGGAQAAHNVITEDGRHHTFAQFGSGTFVPGVKTYLSRYMVVNPLNMFPEADHLIQLGITDVWERMAIDREALVVTPWQMGANRIRELARGDYRHGSCGQGIGETMADSLQRPDTVLRVKDLQGINLQGKLEAFRDYKIIQLQEELGTEVVDFPEWRAFTDCAMVPRLMEAYRVWARLVRIVDGDYLKYLSRRHELLAFEGAQGVLLDEWQGFHPYTTWSTTTHANALQLLSETDFDGGLTRLGVLRAYTTRHGAGPLVTEDATLEPLLKEHHNGTNTWQGAFRYGYFDAVAHRYALSLCDGADSLAITCLDRIATLSGGRICTRYAIENDQLNTGGFFYGSSPAVVSDITRGVRGDLDYQAQLTTLLASCSPIYQTVGVPPGNPRRISIPEYVQCIESCLGLPATITSFGPTAADKRVHVAC